MNIIEVVKKEFGITDSQLSEMIITDEYVCTLEEFILVNYYDESVIKISKEEIQEVINLKPNEVFYIGHSEIIKQ